MVTMPIALLLGRPESRIGLHDFHLFSHCVTQAELLQPYARLLAYYVGYLNVGKILALKCCSVRLRFGCYHGAL